MTLEVRENCMHVSKDRLGLRIFKSIIESAAINV